MCEDESTKKPDARGVGQLAADRCGRNLARLREAAGISPEELSLRSGVHPSEIALIESGKRQARLWTMVDLCRPLDATLEDLCAAGVA